MPVVR